MEWTNKEKVGKYGPYQNLMGKMICAKSEYSNLFYNVCYGDSAGLLIFKEGEENENVLQHIVTCFSGSIIRRRTCDAHLLTGTFTKVLALNGR